MSAMSNPLMNSKHFFDVLTGSFALHLDPTDDLLYGIPQSRNYSSNDRSSEQQRLLNTSPLRTDIRLTVNLSSSSFHSTLLVHLSRMIK